jgi:hypothetical protein
MVEHRYSGIPLWYRVQPRWGTRSRHSVFDTETRVKEHEQKKLFEDYPAMVRSEAVVRRITTVRAARVLTEVERDQIEQIKEHGISFLLLLESLNLQPDEKSYELDQARVNVEQAIMWAAKHIGK